MLDKIKGNTIGFLHPDSIAAVIKVIIAWESQPQVVQALALMKVPQSWLKHEMAMFAFVLWGIDRLHQIYQDHADTVIKP